MSTTESAQSTESLAAQGSASYQVLITMSQQTVQALQAGGFSLYGFKAVQGHQGGGAPLVWLSTDSYLMNTELSWGQQYQAYLSTSQIMPGSQIQVMSAVNVNLGQTVQIQNGGGMTVVPQGTPGAISILNQSFSQYTIGLSQPMNGPTSPYCAFPLYASMMSVLAPVEKVLLMFSTIPMNRGTVVFQAPSQALFIDLTSANQRTVSFDINTGWSWGGAPWAQQIPQNSNLAPLLIES
jgi:hypothetical protein